MSPESTVHSSPIHGEPHLHGKSAVDSPEEVSVIDALIEVQTALTPEARQIIPPETWHLLPKLDVPPRFYPEKAVPVTFLDEAVISANWIKENQDHIGGYFAKYLPDSRIPTYIGLLQAMMIIGDIGKATSSTAHRIYNHLRFNGEINKFMRSTLPSAALSSKIEAWKTTHQVTDFNARDIPTCLALSLHAQYLEHQKPELVAQHQSFFQRVHTLSDRDVRFLTEIGLDPNTTPMKTMFSALHLKTGIRFLRSKPLHESLSLLAFAHHLTQGVVPDSLIPQLQQATPAQRLLVGLSEVLDKYEVQIARVDISDPVVALQNAQTAINSNFDTTFHPALLQDRPSWQSSYQEAHQCVSAKISQFPAL